MLVKLTTNQINDNWDAIKFAIMSALPPTADYSDIGALEIQKKLLDGRMQMWSYINDNNELTAMVSTILLADSGTGDKHLLIYSLYVFGYLPEDAWKEGWETLAIWARGQGCGRLVAYTNIPKVVEHLEKEIGAKVDFKLITVRI
jgi:hypothetical protein